MNKWSIDVILERKQIEKMDTIFYSSMMIIALKPMKVRGTN